MGGKRTRFVARPVALRRNFQPIRSPEGRCVLYLYSNGREMLPKRITNTYSRSVDRFRRFAIHLHHLLLNFIKKVHSMIRMTRSSFTAASAPARYSPLLVLLVLASAMFASAPTAAMSASTSLSGTWRGNGWVMLSSGKREQARCRVRFFPQSARSYSVNAVCATDAGRVSQTATIRKAGGSSYVGSFYNAEYDISGSIQLSVRGATATAKLMSHSGSAVISLRR